jgi:hypothetical protein
MRRARKLLALVVMGIAFVLTLAQAEPAWAYTISRSDTQIVVTSDRLTDITVQVTETLTVRSNGQVTLNVDVHNSGRTRKYYYVEAGVVSPATGVQEWFRYTCLKVGGDSYDSWSKTRVDPNVYPNWSRIRSDPDLHASFTLDAFRVGPNC